MKLLLITHYFPPLNQIASLRMAHWVKYWARDGVQVDVLTTYKHPEDSPRDLAVELPDGVRVLEVDYMFPRAYRWLKRLDTQARERGQSVHAGTGTRRKALWLLRQTVLESMGSLSSPTLLWYGKAVAQGARELERERYDILVSSYSPPVAHLVASRLKKKDPSLFWVADFRDLWVGNHLNPARPPFSWVERFLEGTSVGQWADLVVTVSEPLADYLASSLSKPTIVIENGFDPEEFPGWEQRLARRNGERSRSGGPKIVTFTGTVYAGYHDLTPLFRAIKRVATRHGLSERDLQVRFLGARLPTVAELARTEGVEPFVSIGGHVSRQEVLRIQANSDALLLLGRDDPQSRGVLTGKVFEYLLSGKPVLSIGFSDDSSVAALLNQTGTGVNCAKDIDRITDFLIDLVRTGTWHGFSPNVDAIRRFSREEQARRLLEAVRTEVERRRTAQP